MEKQHLCVIGAGPAGIILVLEYLKLNPSKKVVLVEYGDGRVKNKLDDTIINKNELNHHEPYECTNKGLGGSSATWGGRCVMYDEVDFEERPIVKGGCTWDPTLFEEVNAFLPQTVPYFECGESYFSLNEIEQFRNHRIADNFKEGDVTDSVVERWSMPTRFGDRYQQELRDAPNLTILEGYEARKLTKNTVSGKIESLSFKSIASGEEVVLESEDFVICAGTQESTRILLRNTAIFEGIPKALGHYYQGHLSGKIASIKFNGKPQSTDYGFLKDGEVYIRRRFQFSKDFLVENNLLNTAIWLDNPLYYNPKHRSGAMSLMYLAMITPILGKKLAPPAIAHSVTKGMVYKVPTHLFNILKDFPMSIIEPVKIFYKRYLLKRKLPGIFLYSPDNVYALHFHAEQIPEFTSTMSLAEDGESLVIDYKILEEDIQSVIKLHEKLDNYLRSIDCGHLDYWFAKENLSKEIRQMSKDGIHQSGTTRIAKSKEDGVVNYDLKVFDTDNLYVCSSSVFPTSGQANPTFFLGVFAVRLAQHLTKHEENRIS